MNELQAAANFVSVKQIQFYAICIMKIVEIQSGDEN